MGKKCKETPVLRLWLISFNIGNTGSGCAIVKAVGPVRAEGILRHSGMMSANNSLYRIKTITEIKEGITEGLLAEEMVP